METDGYDFFPIYFHMNIDRRGGPQREAGREIDSLVKGGGQGGSMCVCVCGVERGSDRPYDDSVVE